MTVNIVRVVLELEPAQAAGLKRFADKISHSDAMAVLYPHVKREIRSEQAAQIISAFTALERALGDAGAASFPWIERGRV